MIEIGVSNPVVADERKAACGGRQMEVQVSLEVSAEGVDGQVDSWTESFLCGQFFDDVRSEKWNSIDEVTVDPKEVPKQVWHGEGNVLPGSVRKCVEAVFDPVVCCFFSAG